MHADNRSLSRAAAGNNITPLDGEGFTTVLASATHHAGIPVARSTGLLLEIVHLGQAVRCNLATAFAAYCQAPERLNDIVAAHLAALAALPAESMLPTAAELAAQLMPMLNPRGRLATLQGPELPAPIHRPFAGGLVVTYVIDQPNTMAYVNPRLFATAGAEEPTEAELHALALANLRKRTRPRGYEVHGFGDRMLIVGKELDGYTACRVLLPELMAEWARKVPGRLLVGIPNRDFLIAFSDRDPQHVAAVSRQLRADAGQMARPLTATALLWHEGQLQEYQVRH